MRITFSLLSFTIDTDRDDEPDREVDMGSAFERADRHPIGFRVEAPGTDDPGTEDSR